MEITSVPEVLHTTRNWVCDSLNIAPSCVRSAFSWENLKEQTWLQSQSVTHCTSSSCFLGSWFLWPVQRQAPVGSRPTVTADGHSLPYVKTQYFISGNDSKYWGKWALDSLWLLMKEKGPRTWAAGACRPLLEHPWAWGWEPRWVGMGTAALGCWWETG